MISLFNEVKIALDLLKNGITLNISYNRAILILCKYYKSLNYTSDITKSYVIEWLKNQKCIVSFDTVLHDLDSILKNVYEKQYKIYDDTNISITQEELNQIKSM
jgi:hypothetical protein